MTTVIQLIDHQPSRKPAVKAEKFNFTATAIKAAVTKFDSEKDIWLSDTKVSGLKLRKQAQEWRFYIHKRINAKLVKIALAPLDQNDINVPAIRKAAQETILAAQDGTLALRKTASEKRANAEAMSMTLADAIALHGSLNSRTRASTLKTYTAQIRAALGLETRIASITSTKLTDWYEAGIMRGAAPSGLNSTLAAIKAVWASWASELSEEMREKVGSNPAASMAGHRRKNLKRSTSRTEHLAPADVKPFLSALMAEMRERGPAGAGAAATAFIVLTGLRSREVTELRWSSVRAKAIVLSEGETKGQQDLVRPITSMMAEILDHQRGFATGEFVFPSWKAKDTPVSDLRKAIVRCAAVAGVAPIRPHDLRRSYLSSAASAGIPNLAAKLLVGHATGDITQAYQVGGVARQLPSFAATVEAHLLADHSETESDAWWAE